MILTHGANSISRWPSAEYVYYYNGSNLIEYDLKTGTSKNIYSYTPLETIDLCQVKFYKDSLMILLRPYSDFFVTDIKYTDQRSIIRIPGTCGDVMTSFIEYGENLLVNTTTENYLALEFDGNSYTGFVPHTAIPGYHLNIIDGIITKTDANGNLVIYNTSNGQITTKRLLSTDYNPIRVVKYNSKYIGVRNRYHFTSSDLNDIQYYDSVDSVGFDVGFSIINLRDDIFMSNNGYVYSVNLDGSISIISKFDTTLTTQSIIYGERLYIYESYSQNDAYQEKLYEISKDLHKLTLIAEWQNPVNCRGIALK